MALPLPDPVVAGLDEFLDDVRRPRPYVGWSHPSTWHITVAFLGECGRYEVDRQLDRWAERSADTRPFELRLEGGGAFPHAWAARVLWAAVAGDVDTYARLTGSDAVPHVTVGRSRRQALDLTGAVDEMARLRSERWRADEVQVLASHLGKGPGGGPAYEILQVTPLGV